MQSHTLFNHLFGFNWHHVSYKQLTFLAFDFDFRTSLHYFCAGLSKSHQNCLCR